LTYKYSKEDKKPSKFIKKLVKEEIDETGAKPDSNQNIKEELIESREEILKKTETPEDKEERKQELENRKRERLNNRMEPRTKRAIYYPKGDY